VKSKFKNLVPIYISILVVLAFVFYKPVLSYQFVWDDTQLYINPSKIPPDNPFDKVFENFIPQKDKMYIPVTYFFWSLISAFGGVDNGNFNPFLFHLLNLLLHILNTILVFLLFKRLLNDDFWAFVGAFIFSLHPIQIESVAWISEARGLLSTFWGLLALLIYLQNSKKGIKIVACLVLLSLSILSKPSGIVFPLIIVLLDWFWNNIKNPVDLLKRNVFYLLITLPFIFISFQGEATKTISFEIPILWRPIVWINSLGFYLEKFFIPWNLSPGYGLTFNFLKNNPIYFYSILVGLVAVVAGFVIKRREYWFGLLLLSLGYLPVSNLVTFYYQYWSTVADRYVYFSVIGFAFWISYFASLYLKKYRAYYLIGLGVIFFLFSQKEISKWQDEFSLWQDCIEKYPERIPHPYLGRGMIFESQGNLYSALNDYSKAVTIDSSYYFGYYNRGNINLDLRRYSEAIKDFTRAIQFNPNYVNSYVNRGLCYLELGEYRNSIEDFTKALVLDSLQADVWYSLGDAYFSNKDYSRALSCYLKAKDLGLTEKDLLEKIEQAKKATSQYQ